MLKAVILNIRNIVPKTYMDIMQFKKLMKNNNITNEFDLIKYLKRETCALQM